MMSKEKSSPWARMKYLYILPVAAIAVTAFARPEISNTAKEISVVKVNDLAAIVETKVTESVDALPGASKTVALPADTTKPAEVKYVPKEVKGQLNGSPVFEITEEAPEFPGGDMPALVQYFRENMRYPEAAKKKGVQGRVTVQFVVCKDGSIKDAKVVRSVEPELDAEAIRLVYAMPKWKPGMQKGQAVDTKFTAPVLFKLDADESADSKSGEVREGIIRMDGGEDPLFIVDGKEVTPAIMHALDANKIESIKVLKDEAATGVYGEKGKNGAILITLKQGTPGIVIHRDREVKGTEKVSVQGNMKVEGKVVDEQGSPVIGAVVRIEGTNMGSVTDLDGNFVLSVPSKDDILVVSYIGMATAKAKVQPKVTVTLKNE